jgi:hypothetical protein
MYTVLTKCMHVQLCFDPVFSLPDYRSVFYFVSQEITFPAQSVPDEVILHPDSAKILERAEILKHHGKIEHCRPKMIFL